MLAFTTVGQTVTLQATASGVIDWVVVYADKTSTLGEISVSGTLATTSAITVITGPASGSRLIKSVYITNTSGATVTVTTRVGGVSYRVVALVAGATSDVMVPTVPVVPTVTLWGSITGTLSNQTDLQAALDLKAVDSLVVHKAGSETITGVKSFSGQIVSTVATGSSPFTVASTTAVTNLNADLLDGQHGSYYATDTGVVHIAGTETITGIKTFSQGVGLNLVKMSGGWNIIQMENGATHVAWQIGVQSIVNESMDFTPSTVVGGTTFTTPAFVIRSALHSNGLGIYTPGHGEFAGAVYCSAIRSVTGHSAIATNYGTAVAPVENLISEGAFLVTGQYAAGVYAVNSFNSNLNNFLRFRVSNGGTSLVALTLAQDGAATFASSVACTTLTASGNITGSSPSVHRYRSYSGAALISFGSVEDSSGYFGSESNHPVSIVTNAITALTISTSQAATFASSVAAASAVIGTDPGGSELLRVGGTLRVGGAATFASSVTAYGTISTTVPDGTNGYRLLRSTNDSQFIIDYFSGSFRIVSTYGATGSFNPIAFYTSDLLRGTIQTDGVLAWVTDIQCRSLIGNDTALTIRQNTIDGSDNHSVLISGGGAVSQNNGAVLQLYGNEAASYGGNAYLDAGLGGSVLIRGGNSAGLQIGPTGAADFTNNVSLGGVLRVNGGYASANGDLGVARTATTGAIYFGTNSTTRYIYSEAEVLYFGTHVLNPIAAQIGPRGDGSVPNLMVLGANTAQGWIGIGTSTYGIQAGSDYGGVLIKNAVGTALTLSNDGYAYFYGGINATFITGTAQLNIVTSITGDNPAYIRNTHSAGYGPAFRGGGGSSALYTSIFQKYDGSELMSLTGDGDLVVNTGRNTRFGGTAISIGASSSGYPDIGYNLVRDATATQTYRVADTASKIDFGNGSVVAIRMAASGTGGTAITWSTPFQAHLTGATINGNLEVNDGAALQIIAHGATQGSIKIYKTGLNGYQIFSNADHYLGFYDNQSGTTPLEIDSTGINVAGTIRAGYSFASNNGTGNALRLLSPGGAAYTYGGYATGAIKITLPRTWSDTMLRFTIKIYDYTGSVQEITVGGYAYSGGSTWYNCGAHATGSNEFPLNVRFGHDGTYCCVYLGELATVWNYPVVTITDFQAGYSSYNINQWDQGWTVGIEPTAFGTITVTKPVQATIPTNVVHITGAETVTGAKTFSAALICNDTISSTGSGVQTVLSYGSTYGTVGTNSNHQLNFIVNSTAVASIDTTYAFNLGGAVASNSIAATIGLGAGYTRFYTPTDTAPGGVFTPRIIQRQHAGGTGGYAYGTIWDTVLGKNGVPVGNGDDKRTATYTLRALTDADGMASHTDVFTLTGKGDAYIANRLWLTSTTGFNDSQLHIAKTGTGTAFDVLSLDGSVYVIFGASYSGGSWTSDGDGYANCGLMTYSAANNAMYWYCDSGGDFNWDQAGNVELWNSTGTWRSSVSARDTIYVRDAAGNNPQAVATNSFWGYSSSYRITQIGTTGAATLAFNVDVSGNASGSFTGDGTEYIWRTAGRFITPNAANTGYNVLLGWNNAGSIYAYNQMTVGGPAGNGVTEATAAVRAGNIASDKYVVLGYDTVNDRGFIQAVHSGTVNKDIIINPNGNSVYLGGSGVAYVTGSGYMIASYHYSTDDVSTGTPSGIMAKFGDNYYRTMTQAKLFQFAGTGTPSSTTYLRGDGTWSAPTSVGYFYAKIANSAAISISSSTTATVNRMHWINIASAGNIGIAMPSSPSAGDVVGFTVYLNTSYKKYAAQLDAGAGVKIAGRTQFLHLLAGNSILLWYDGSAWMPLAMNLDTEWVSDGPLTIFGSTSNPSKGTASTTTDELFWRRVGNSVEVRFAFSKIAVADDAAGSGVYYIQMPFLSVQTIQRDVANEGLSATAYDQWSIALAGHGTMTNATPALVQASVFMYSWGYVTLAYASGVLGSAAYPMNGAMRFSGTCSYPVIVW